MDTCILFCRSNDAAHSLFCLLASSSPVHNYRHGVKWFLVGLVRLHCPKSILLFSLERGSSCWWPLKRDDPKRTPTCIMMLFTPPLSPSFATDSHNCLVVYVSWDVLPPMCCSRSPQKQSGTFYTPLPSFLGTSSQRKSILLHRRLKLALISSGSPSRMSAISS